MNKLSESCGNSLVHFVSGTSSLRSLYQLSLVPVAIPVIHKINSVSFAVVELIRIVVY